MSSGGASSVASANKIPPTSTALHAMTFTGMTRSLPEVVLIAASLVTSEGRIAAEEWADEALVGDWSEAAVQKYNMLSKSQINPTHCKTRDEPSEAEESRNHLRERRVGQSDSHSDTKKPQRHHVRGGGEAPWPHPNLDTDVDQSMMAPSHP